MYQTAVVLTCTRLVFWHRQGPTLLVDFLPGLSCLLYDWIQRLNYFFLFPLQLSKSFLSLMKDGFLSLKDRPSFLESSDDVDIFADLALLDQRQDSLIEFIGLDGILLMKRVESNLLRQDIRLLLGKLWFGDEMLANCPACPSNDSIRFGLLEGVFELRDLFIL